MACAEYIVCGELPFRHVENVAFKAFYFKLQPKFKPPSRTPVARDCYQLYLDMKTKLCLKEIEKFVASIRLACKFVQSSTVRQQLFEECCERGRIETKALLCLDVATRWNSTYLMLDTAIRFQKVFDRMVGDGNYDNYFIEEDQQPPTDDDWEQVQVQIRHFYAKCRKPQDYIEALCQKIEKLLKDLFSLYNKENPQSSNDKQNTQSALVEVEEQESDLFAEYADPEDSSSSKHEVDKYLNDSYEPYTRQFDILSLWRLNGHKILDSFRSSLHPRMVETLMCFHDWLLASSLLPIMDEEYREELDNLLHSQKILAEMEAMSIGSHSLGEQLPSIISEGDDSEGDSD
ncbi:uncharacterized protein LOC120271527 [Dioscorea cayenensis subsp. rotundata]|uniref:Uncharacterized protein LOC120271527 n=1 Tax=Dioscorea cayennensis subsp. rotundata TaxID=55577 RepID=A0AB40C5C3_DIOCR|nr:uncharacterized protein LOC120271527 [Dioscorea cayenensis subsp. rotundata]